MTPAEAAVVLREARKWASEGLLPRESLATVEARYGAVADGTSAGGRSGAIALLGLGGALLGAAVIGLLVVLGVSPGLRAYALIASAAGWLAVGMAMARRSPTEGLADALLVAALVDVIGAGAASMGERSIPALAASLLSPFLFWWFRDRRLVPTAAGFAFYPLTAIAAATVLSSTSRLAAAVYAIAGVAWLVAALVLGKALRSPWRNEVLATASLGVATCAIAFSHGVLSMTSSTKVELAVGVAMGVLFATGLVAREKGLIFGAGLMLVIDALVFAFDLGGYLTGVILLVLLAAAVLWRAARRSPAASV